MKKKIIILVLLILNTPIFAQTSKYFNKHWGQLAPLYDGATNVLQLPDSTYFITTESYTQILNSNVKSTIKINKVGNIFSMQPDSDLTFLRSIGQNLIYNHNYTKFYTGTGLVWYNSLGVGKSVPYIYVFDSIGHFLTPFIIGDTANMKTGSVLSIVLAKNKFLFCSGGIGKAMNNSTKLLSAYWKVDTLGNTIWEKRDSSSNCCSNNFLAIKEDSIGNFIMLGKYKNQSSASSTERLWLRKIDTNGNTLWDYKYNEADVDSFGNDASLTPRSLSIANDGNYMVGAEYRTTFGSVIGWPSAFVKFSAVDGHIIWRFNMVTIDTNYTYANYIEKIVPIPGEGYVLFGSLYDKRGDIAAFISKINENGQELWRKTFGTTVGYRDVQHDDYFFDGIQTLDGGFAAVGQTAGAPFLVDAWLIKTNCNGDTAAPVAQFNAVVDYTNNHIVSIQNQSLRYDTCIYNFGDGSPLVYKSYLDTGIFTHTYTNIAAAYNISMIAKSCNQDYDTTQTSVTTGLNSSPWRWSKLELSPNPANSYVIIKYNSNNRDKQVYFVITDITGKVIRKIDLQRDKANYQIETGNLSKGFYHVCLYEDGVQTDCKKLIIN